MPRSAWSSKSKSMSSAGIPARLETNSCTRVTTRGCAVIGCTSSTLTSTRQRRGSGSTKRSGSPGFGRSRMGNPRVIKPASASRKDRSPPSLGWLVYKARCGLFFRIATVKPVKARFGPHSTNTRAPSPYIRSIWAVHSTGAATWRARFSMAFSAAPGPVGYHCEVVLVVMGRRGSLTCSLCSTCFIGPLAGATISEWNAWDTGNG